MNCAKTRDQLSEVFSHLVPLPSRYRRSYEVTVAEALQSRLHADGRIVGSPVAHALPLAVGGEELAVLGFELFELLFLF